MVKKANQANTLLMDMMEAAAFVVCLDEESPNNSSERANHSMWADPRNRWQVMH